MRKRFYIAGIGLAVVCLLLCTILPFNLGKTVDNALPSEPTQLSTLQPTQPITTEPIPTVTIPHEDMPVTDTNITSDTVHTLTFVGDCTLGTMPSWQSYERCFNNIVKQNYQHPFATVKQYFENDACTFINLEGVLANEGKAEEKRFTFIGPTDYVQILTGSSVEFANLSNNHTYDFGQAGYDSTIKTLQDNCVRYVGRNDKTIFTTKSGLTIGVYGVYFDLAPKAMQCDVQALKDMGADIIIAACHWGIERDYHPSAQQQNAAYKLIDAGVNIVWGHHPHVLQPIEEYKNGVIYYSLGNFSFGGNHNPSDKDTAIIQQHIIERADGSISIGRHTIIPCRLSSKNTYNDFQPTPYAKEDKGYERTLNKLTAQIPAKPNTPSSGSGSGSSDTADSSTTKPTIPTSPTKPELTVDDKVKKRNLYVASHLWILSWNPEYENHY